jgi:hypothetical protein
MEHCTLVQIALWDLALEKDTEGGEETAKLKDLPPQLLFIHQDIIPFVLHQTSLFLFLYCNEYSAIRTLDMHSVIVIFNS